MYVGVGFSYCHIVNPKQKNSKFSFSLSPSRGKEHTHTHAFGVSKSPLCLRPLLCCCCCCGDLLHFETLKARL